MEIQGPYAGKLRFRATDHNNEEIFQSEIDTKTDDNEAVGTIIVGPILFSLKDLEGYLKIECKEEGGEWLNVIKRKTKYYRR